MNPPLCTDSDSMDTLSFIFPITEQSTIDCMVSQLFHFCSISKLNFKNSDDILLDYTATIFDVERISGFQFGLGALSQNQNTIIRRKISTKLW